MKKTVFVSIILLLGYFASNAQTIGVKTNLLFTGVTKYSPNLGVEFSIGNRSTIELWGAGNSYTLAATGAEKTPQNLKYYIAMPEYRFWLCRKFQGHFFGAHGIYADYNISGFDIPLLFDKELRYNGVGYGAGISYGYHWMWSKRWGMEFTVGGGYINLTYDKFNGLNEENLGKFKKNYFGLTKAGISLIFLIK